MKIIVTGKEMQLLDKNTSQHYGVPAIVLMEQAAIAFVQELFLYKNHPGKVLIVAGTGNNGGDGIAIARLLNQKGLSCDLYLMEDLLPGARTSASHDIQKDIYRKYGFPEVSLFSGLTSGSYDVVIDAVFGVGLSREVTGVYADVISVLNKMNCIRIAVDIASGISADTGAVLGTAFRADLTITFSFGKTGMYLWPGNEYSGDIRIAEIGITDAGFLGDLKPHMLRLEDQDLKQFLPKRKAHSNKGTYGKLLIIGGSVNMAGAVIFAARAAYRSGCGLVRILSCEENRSILQTAVPEAILTTYRDPIDINELSDVLKWADGIVIGPGLGTGGIAQQLVKAVIRNAEVPVLFDADALNILSENPALLFQLHAAAIITPHLGEMSRLTGLSVPELQKKLPETAHNFAHNYGLVCVLKDFRTIIAGPEQEYSYMNFTGNNGMAAGGSGDVLSGMIGSLIVQKADPFTAAACGVYLHGRAGDKAAVRKGYYGMMASDLIESIPEAFCSCT